MTALPPPPNPLLQEADAILNGESEATPEMATALVEYNGPIDFPPRLAYEVALQVQSLPQLSERYDISIPDLKELMTAPHFKGYVAAFRNDIKEHGLGFRMRARAAAEDALDMAIELLKDKDVDAETRRKVSGDIVKWAGLEPTKEKPVDTAPVVNVQINL